jgi:hypothetical protein
MNNIELSRQNSATNLARLAAQRWLYSLGKKAIGVQVFLAIPVMIGVCIIGRITGNAFAWIGASISVSVLAVDLLWLSPMANRLRAKAARIQEQFDVEVLGIEQNSVLIGQQVDLEEIQAFACKYPTKKKGYNDLLDWYSTEVDGLPIEVARVICQRSNLWWDAELRRGYMRLIISTCVVVVLGLTVFCLVLDTGLQAFILSVVFPLLPLISFTTRQQIDNAAVVRKLEQVKSDCENMWERIKIDDIDTTFASVSRQVQDVIFSKRETSPLVFDWYYWTRRKELSKMNEYSAQEMVRTYRNKK